MPSQPHEIPSYPGDRCISTSTALGIGCKGKVKVSVDVLRCPKCGTEYGRVMTV